jgi:hypothetical protein
MKLAMARKISLDDAKTSGATAILIACTGAPIAGGGCRHSAEIGIDDAIARWGGARRLDALPLRCSACGGRQVDVRPHYEHRSAGAFIWKETDDWRAQRALEVLSAIARYLNALKLPPIR